MFRIVRWWSRRAGSDAESVELTVEELARLWLPYNREPWARSADATAVATAGAAAGETGVAASAASPVGEARAREGSAPAPAPAPGPVKAPADGPRRVAAVELPAPFGPVLAPYAERCRTQGLWPVIERAVAALMEHGDGPSLVLERGAGDQEAKDLYSVRESLGRVSLRDHTAHVLAAMVALVREQYRDAESQMPRAALAALAHDLGKVPAWRAVGAYGKQDHAAISAVKLREWVGSDEEPWWLASVLAAVRDHHRRSTDLLTQLLQRADLRAREQEVAAATAGLSVQAFPAWMDAEAWRARVAAEIDMLQKGNQWLAVSCGAVVYAKIELLLGAAREVMRARGAVDLVFLADGQRERAAAKLVAWIRARGWLADEIGEGYYGLPYDVEVTQPHRSPVTLPVQYLVPLKLEAFGSAGAFRQRKAGVLALVTAVRKRPLGGVA